MTRKHFKRAAEIIAKIEDPQVRRATALSLRSGSVRRIQGSKLNFSLMPAALDIS